MRVGMVGLGKLGMPIAEAIASKGHEVKGYDVVPKDFPESVTPSDIEELVRWGNIIFAAPQTPHAPEFEGTTRLPEDRADFDYSHLKECVGAIAIEATRQKKETNLVVISTCLPGTFEREIEPLLDEYINYIYQPLFIAMGTEKEDFLDPEFVLIGGANPEILEEFYKTIHGRPLLVTDIITAEGIKVSYNTWITAKTVIANLWGEIAFKTGMRFEDIYRAWSLATDRLISPRYMRAGMSDGGGCHPRDNIALSWLAQQINLSHNLFDDIMRAREDYEEWHAELALSFDLPLVLLGRAFKPESDIETGSAALLLANILQEKGATFQHVEDLEDLPRAVYFIATNHKRYKDYKFPSGSVVINPSEPELVSVIE